MTFFLAVYQTPEDTNNLYSSKLLFSLEEVDSFAEIQSNILHTECKEGAIISGESVYFEFKNDDLVKAIKCEFNQDYALFGMFDSFSIYVKVQDFNPESITTAETLARKKKAWAERNYNEGLIDFVGRPVVVLDPVTLLPL